MDSPSGGQIRNRPSSSSASPEMHSLLDSSVRLVEDRSVLDARRPGPRLVPRHPSGALCLAARAGPAGWLRPDHRLCEDRERNQIHGSSACLAQREQVGQPANGPQLELLGRLVRVGGHRTDKLAAPPDRPHGAAAAPGVPRLEGLEVKVVVPPANGSGSGSHAAPRSGSGVTGRNGLFGQVCFGASARAGTASLVKDMGISSFLWLGGFELPAG